MTPRLRDRLVGQVVDFGRVFNAPRGYRRYVRDLRRYRTMSGSERIEWDELYPQIHDRLPVSPYDGHYFYQDVWAARRVSEHGPARHVDVGSRVDYVGFLTAITQVTFVDIRPLETQLPDLDSVAGSVLALPFADESVESISCLHVAEHIGLGRYGDELDPAGTRKAAAELERVLSERGQLLFSLPVGRPRLCFNAHRIHDPRSVPPMFPALQLREFSGVDDAGAFRRDRELEELAGSDYACGLYVFERP